VVNPEGGVRAVVGEDVAGGVGNGCGVVILGAVGEARSRWVGAIVGEVSLAEDTGAQPERKRTAAKARPRGTFLRHRLPRFQRRVIRIKPETRLHPTLSSPLQVERSCRLGQLLVSRCDFRFAQRASRTLAAGNGGGGCESGSRREGGSRRAGGCRARSQARRGADRGGAGRASSGELQDMDLGERDRLWIGVLERDE